MEQSKFYQIKNVTEHEYTLVGCDGSVITRPIQDIDKSASIFTIQDAKDGDVLSFNDGHGNDCIELIKSITEERKDKKIEFWFCLTNNELCEVFDGVTPYTNMTSRQNATPATKEQRATLMNAMADAGYTFDFEKKELKKIDNEEVDGKDYGIDSLWYAKNILEETLGKVDGYQTDDGILEHKCAIAAVNKLYKQKPAWSEEDEEMLENAISSINHDSVIEGLKSRGISYSIDSSAHLMENLITWLKSLKNRVQPQPQKEWSEEHEYVFDKIINWAKLVNPTSSIFEKLPKEQFIERLESLKERYTWKPSEEHYELEEFAKIVRGNLTGISKAVQELFKAKYLQLTGNKMYGGFKD